MILNWQSSGMSQTIFCKTNGIAYHSFHYWFRAFRSSRPQFGKFLPVRITTSGVTGGVILIKGSSGIEAQLPLTLESLPILRELLHG